MTFVTNWYQATQKDFNVTNITFDFIGLHLFGNINGVALATLFTFLSGVFFGYFWLKKYLNFTLLGFFTVGFGEIKIMIRQFFSKTKIASE